MKSAQENKKLPNCFAKAAEESQSRRLVLQVRIHFHQYRDRAGSEPEVLRRSPFAKKADAVRKGDYF
jgi:hypothetical protein